MATKPKIAIDSIAPKLSVVAQVFVYTQFWDDGVILWDGSRLWDTGVLHNAPSLSVVSSRPIISTV